MLVTLDKDVVGGGIADDEFGDNDDNRITDSGKDGSSRTADENSNESLSDSKVHRGAGLDNDKPDGVAGDKYKVDGQEG